MIAVEKGSGDLVGAQMTAARSIASALDIDHTRCPICVIRDLAGETHFVKSNVE
jgi:hypothetical protein